MPISIKSQNDDVFVVTVADSTVTGFNNVNNVGENAGQTVIHCHKHLIPRRKGDVEEP